MKNHSKAGIACAMLVIFVLFTQYAAAGPNVKLKGDVNGDQKVDLADTVLILQLLTGFPTTGVAMELDINGNRKVGLEEVNYVLQIVAGRRLASPRHAVEGLNFSPYIDANENPELGGDQITGEELESRIRIIAPYTKWIRTFG